MTILQTATGDLSASGPPSAPAEGVLGRQVTYPDQFDAQLLFPIPRQIKRAELGLHEGQTLPFFGVDFWNAYEVSWLNRRGKPVVAIMTMMVPADSPHLVESKSLKLYLNSFNQTRFGADGSVADAVSTDGTGLQQVSEQIRVDLSRVCGAAVAIRLVPASEFADQKLSAPAGLLLDRLDIEVNEYLPDPALLSADHAAADTEETLVSHLLKSNCLITGQPDWASIQIHYAGAPINQEGLLRYLIGFRNHNEFHEQCVERIFCDIQRLCKPLKLTVYARYTRRGGIDINPWRSNVSSERPELNLRWARQ